MPPLFNSVCLDFGIIQHEAPIKAILYKILSRKFTLLLTGGVAGCLIPILCKSRLLESEIDASVRSTRI